MDDARFRQSFFPHDDRWQRLHSVSTSSEIRHSIEEISRHPAVEILHRDDQQRVRRKRDERRRIDFLIPVRPCRSLGISDKNLIVRALLILQQTQLKNHILILPAFAANVTVTPITSQFDIKKFLIYWREDRVRLPEFLLLDLTKTLPNKTLPYEAGKTYDDVNGILIFPIETIPLNLPPPTAQLEVQIRDSLYWCSPPHLGGGWCIHHPRDYGATMELLFSCRGDPYPPCANKTETNEQFLKRPYETS